MPWADCRKLKLACPASCTTYADVSPGRGLYDMAKVRREVTVLVDLHDACSGGSSRWDSIANLACLGVTTDAARGTVSDSETHGGVLEDAHCARGNSTWIINWVCCPSDCGKSWFNIQAYP